MGNKTLYSFALFTIISSTAMANSGDPTILSESQLDTLVAGNAEVTVTASAQATGPSSSTSSSSVSGVTETPGGVATIGGGLGIAMSSGSEDQTATVTTEGSVSGDIVKVISFGSPTIITPQMALKIEGIRLVGVTP